MKKASSIQLGYRKWGLVQECFPKHWRMGTARMKLDEETEEEGNEWGVSIERSKDDTKNKSQRPITT